MNETALHRNPFWLLGATLKDNRQRIGQLADAKSFDLDDEVCRKARSDLTNPRVRLAVEIAWLPGISPAKAAQLTDILLSDPMSIRQESGLPALAHANLMASAFEAVDHLDDPEDICRFIQEMASLVDSLSIGDVVRDIRTDRVISGFPEIIAEEKIEAEIAERKRYYLTAIRDALNRLPALSLIKVVTLAIDNSTSSGRRHAPELIHELVDRYETETQSFLQREAENVHKLIKATRDSAKEGEKVVKPLVDKLEIVARNWDKIAQPIQLSAKARGTSHKPSMDVASAIRDLAVVLFNEHDMLSQSKRITALLKELFAELPEVLDLAEHDARALEDIFENRLQAESRRDEWARSITYHADVGTFFKDTLSISPEGVAWKSQRYPLDSITRVRWGGVSHSVNGVPTGTTYTLAFGDSRSEAVVDLKRGEIFSTFVDKLWRAVGFRLIAELLESLKSGREVAFGDAVVRDNGITLIKQKIFGRKESVRCSWSEIHVWSADGSFYIGAKDDKDVHTGLSYIDTANTHVLEQVIRMVLNRAGARRLSDLLTGD